MGNPILIEVTRGALVESVHRGSVAIAGPSGQAILALGDVERPVFPRSAIKSLQCLPMVECGAADHFKFGDEEIALACASHTGTERHTAVAARMLDRIGLTEAALGCGSHAPLSVRAARALYGACKKPTQLHNNCSGKHAGMLAVAVHQGHSVAGYWSLSHPVQRRVRQTLAEMSGLQLGDDSAGIDGCSVPNWPMPLSVVARLFAQLVTGERLTASRSNAARRILEACWSEPELVAGPGRCDTVVMQNLAGEVFLKSGAEGVCGGAFPSLKVGFALKIDDGASRAATAVATTLIERLVPDAGHNAGRCVIRNWRRTEVGAIRPSAEFALSLQRLTH